MSRLELPPRIPYPPGGSPFHVRGSVYEATQRYDVLPMARLLPLEARAEGVSAAEYMRGRARFQAAGDIRWFYRNQLKSKSLEEIALRMAELISLVFDFAVCHGERRGPGHVEVNVYTETALHLAGAVQCTCRLRPPEPTALVDGLELSTLRTDILWRSRS